MTVEAEVKEGSIFFYENGKLTYASLIEWALWDLRWANAHQPAEMSMADYKGCLAEPEHIIRSRKDKNVVGYRIEGHSHCPWCKHHYKVKDDPAGGCTEDVSIYAHFEDSVHGPIDSEDFLIGRIPVKERVKVGEKSVTKINCPFYDFKAEATS